MDKKFVAASLVCMVLVVGVFGAAWMLYQKDAELQTKTKQISGLTNDVASLENQKSILEAEAATMQANISSLQSEAAALTTEKSALESQVTSLQAEVADLDDENSALTAETLMLQENVSSLQSEMVVLESTKFSLETQVSSLEIEVTTLEGEVIENFNLGYDSGRTEGYELGYDEGYTQGVEDVSQTGWHIVDPTYEEAMAFIVADKTDQNQYTPDYVCYDFTADFNENALQAGYQCGFVYIEFSDSAHAISCFETTDKGLIYVEPQNDEIVTLTVGQQYLGYTIVGIGIIW